jgi:hypothetical protein
MALSANNLPRKFPRHVPTPSGIPCESRTAATRAMTAG